MGGGGGGVLHPLFMANFNISNAGLEQVLPKIGQKL